MKIGISNDHSAVEMKNEIKKYLEENLTTKKSIEILENTYKKNI